MMLRSNSGSYIQQIMIEAAIDRNVMMVRIGYPMQLEGEGPNPTTSLQVHYP